MLTGALAIAIFVFIFLLDHDTTSPATHVMVSSTEELNDKSEHRKPMVQESKTVFGVTFLPGDWAGEWPWIALRDLGIDWVRLDMWMGEPEYAQHLKTRISRTLAEGHGLWLTLYHRDRSNIKDQKRLDQSTRGGFPAVDRVRYQELVRNTIQPLAEDLRAQGKNPKEWLVIQIENEVAPEDVAQPGPTRWWHGTADQYLETLSLGYDAVKSIDPEISVAVAGIASEALEIVRRDPNGAASRWLDRMLREGRFDVADVHLYHAIDTIPAKVAWVRERWKGPLGATEVGGPDERTGATYSDVRHAEDLRARILAVQSIGINWIFWLSLTEAPTADRLGQTMGLTRTDGSRKPAFTVYQQLIKELHK